MKTVRRSSKGAKRPAAKKRKKVVALSRTGQAATVARSRVLRRRRVRAHEREVFGSMCRVIGIHPDAETIVLTDIHGKQALVPIASVSKDGQLARDLADLAGRDVWLSLRLP